MTAALAQVITAPGVYDLPAEEYHADPVHGGSLSSTGARKLLDPSCPAKYRWWADNPQPPKREFEHGHAAHQLVLGAGPELVLVGRDRWDTNAVKDEVAAIRAAGNVPLKRADYDMVLAMAAALRAHPWAGKLFEPGTGEPERAIVWQDKSTGVWCRALLDWLPRPTRARFILRDYKTAASAAPTKLSKATADHGYHIQLAFHLMGLRALGLAGDDAQALLVAQEKEPPHVVTVAQPDPTAMRIGAFEAREALRVYAECAATGHWRGYSDDVVPLALPAWVENAYPKEPW